MTDHLHLSDWHKHKNRKQDDARCGGGVGTQENVYAAGGRV